MLSATGLVSHAVAAAGFLSLGLWLLLRGRPGWFRLGIALASITTALWAAAMVWVGLSGGSPAILALLETVRSAAWVAVLVLHLRRFWGLDERPSSSFVVALMLGFVVALQVALDLLFNLGDPGLQLAGQPPGALLFVATRIVVAISGLVLVHNLHVNARDTMGPEIRFLAVGLGALFAYDLNLYTMKFLLGGLSEPLWNLRGAVNAMVIPLLALSLRSPVGRGFFVSRQVAFNTISFSAIGLYLIAMSVLAYGLRLAGGDWGLLLQILFVAGTLIFGALIALSPRVRALIKVWISRNFYRYRYDYRAEWLRFVDKIDSAQPGAADPQPIRERLVEAMAMVMDSPGGALLEPDEAGGWHRSAQWRWPSLRLETLPAGDPLAAWMRAHGKVVNLPLLAEEAAGRRGVLTHSGLSVPVWLHGPKDDAGIWLAVPLLRREALVGIVLLEHSLAPRELNWEDYDLLRTLGRQGASYLAEAATQAALDEARSFEEFNRRFAFVMHDIKNLVSQVALVARNAERHADNPEFRADMLATLNNSVTKMTDLLALLGQETRGRSAEREASSGQPVDLAAVAAAVVAAKRRLHAAIALVGADAPAFVAGDSQRLEAMLGHLLQNAIDASAPDAPIEVSIARAGDGQVALAIRDRGHGMSASFIRDELFRPFRSTKEGGYGIGAFEAREIARAHRGTLAVESRPGDGSRFVVTLPVLSAHELGQPARA
jgi:putative PEP-CTERM system histidine kinase